VYAGNADKGFYVEIDSLVKVLDYTGKIVCDKLKPFANYGRADYTAASSGITAFPDSNNTYPNQNWIYAKADGITTAADFKTWLASNPLQVVYELAAPVTYQLTPTEVDSLLGENNFWHDANGNTTAVYRADTALYIAKKIAEAVA
jgi:hypothetical protein